MSRPVVERDSRVPALIVKIGQYPLHSGGVGAIRTLGRLGVPVYATTEDRFTPAAPSRYCTGWFRWRTSGREDPGELVGGLRDIGRRLGRRSVAVPVDDEAAVLIAEHADELSEYFLLPWSRLGCRGSWLASMTCTACAASMVCPRLSRCCRRLRPRWRRSPRRGPSRWWRRTRGRGCGGAPLWWRVRQCCAPHRSCSR